MSVRGGVYSQASGRGVTKSGADVNSSVFGKFFEGGGGETRVPRIGGDTTYVCMLTYGLLKSSRCPHTCPPTVPPILLSLHCPPTCPPTAPPSVPPTWSPHLPPSPVPLSPHPSPSPVPPPVPSPVSPLVTHQSHPPASTLVMWHRLECMIFCASSLLCCAKEADTLSHAPPSTSQSSHD